MEEQVLATVETLVSALNNGHMGAASECYAEDAFLIASGRFTCGRKAILERYRNNPISGILRVSLIECRCVGTMATAFFEWSIRESGRNTASEIGQALLSFALDADGRALIVHDFSN